MYESRPKTTHQANEKFQVGHISLDRRQRISKISTPTLTWDITKTLAKPGLRILISNYKHFRSVMRTLWSSHRVLEEEKQRLDTIPAIVPEKIRAAARNITSATDGTTIDDRTIEAYLNIYERFY
jgi:hypothetical protein